MRSFFGMTGLFALWLCATGAASYGVYMHRPEITDLYSTSKNVVMNRYTGAKEWALDKAENVKNSASSMVYTGTGRLMEFADSLLRVQEPGTQVKTPPLRHPREGFINASYDLSAPPPALTLTEIRKRQQEDEEARLYAQIIPAAAPDPTWTPDQPSLDVEAVLVPNQIAVISSSQDGRIADIPVSHGDRFKKGDLLVAYDCSGIRAEADIATIEKAYTQKRLAGSDKLFKLDIISDIDRAGAKIEDDKARVKDKLYQARLKDCDIRAEFDGRVTNRLANPGEYTRTDRVLLEVASDETLQAEFLVPSKWLRWINVGAPVSLNINETERNYTAKITRIHGEVDPVSQSIQMIAKLDPYQDPLLPGMSGKATIDVDAIRKAGVLGYLEANAPKR